MEPFPLAASGAVVGWAVHSLFGGASPSPVPTACSCTCECPVRGEDTGIRISTLVVGVLLAFGFGILGGILLLFWVRNHSEKPVNIIASPVKGRKGLGVVGKTLELTQ